MNCPSDCHFVTEARVRGYLDALNHRDHCDDPKCSCRLEQEELEEQVAEQLAEATEKRP